MTTETIVSIEDVVVDSNGLEGSTDSRPSEMYQTVDDAVLGLTEKGLVGMTIRDVREHGEGQRYYQDVVNLLAREGENASEFWERVGIKDGRRHPEGRYDSIESLREYIEERGWTGRGPGEIQLLGKAGNALIMGIRSFAEREERTIRGLYVDVGIVYARTPRK